MNGAILFLPIIGVVAIVILLPVLERIFLPQKKFVPVAQRSPIEEAPLPLAYTDEEMEWIQDHFDAESAVTYEYTPVTLEDLMKRTANTQDPPFPAPPKEKKRG